MTTFRRIAVMAVLGASLALLGACNFPTRASPQDAAATAAAQTVSAQLTQISVASPTLPPTNTPPPTVAATDTPPPTAAPPTPTLGCSDGSQFVSDVTVPDNTNMTSGQTFTKTWRLRNSGTCTWTTAYDVVFTDGNGMSGPASVALAGSVPPGSTVDVSVNLTAPSTNGTHRGNWRLRNDKDVFFGTAFYLQIVVGPTPTPTVSVHKTGSITVDNSFYVDLDAGTITGGSDRDIWLHAVSALERYLEPQNGAGIRLMSGTPSYADCAGASLSSSAVNFTTFSTGSWFCYKTSSGRFGRFEVESMPASGITLDFRTWTN